MGSARPKPKRLAEKLLQIRNTLGLSQQQMYRRLGVEDFIEYNEISKFELGRREPYLQILLQYARVAGIPAEVLMDDDLDLPERLPDTAKHEEIKRRYASRHKLKR
jgi:transcriptional regulator with XRE-family HTH domain